MRGLAWFGERRKKEVHRSAMGENDLCARKRGRNDDGGRGGRHWYSGREGGRGEGLSGSEEERKRKGRPWRRRRRGDKTWAEPKEDGDREWGGVLS